MESAGIASGALNRTRADNENPSHKWGRHSPPLMRWVLVSSVSRGAGNQLLRQRRELVHPERLESNHRAQIPYLTHQSLIELIVTGHDGDRRLAMPRLRSQSAEELETIHHRHPEVYQDGVRE